MRRYEHRLVRCRMYVGWERDHFDGKHRALKMADTGVGRHGSGERVMYGGLTLRADHPLYLALYAPEPVM